MGALLIRVLALLGLLWTGKQVVHQVTSAIRPHNNKKCDPEQDENSAEMVKDPQCQTYIPKALAIQKQIRGETYYFCGHECAAKFAEQQERTN